MCVKTNTIEAKEKVYWLFTCNYLNPFKKYYTDKEELLTDLYKIIDDSKPVYKKSLKRAALEEKAKNLENIDKEKYIPTEICNRKHEKWKDFSEEELQISIKILDLTGLEKERREAIFKDKIRENLVCNTF